MKTLSKLILLSLSIVVFISCQKEINSITQPSDEEVLKASSPVAELVSKTVTNDGSKDNIIDKASCISVNLPVTVQANGITLTIENEDGLELIEEIFDELDDDDDILEIVFPIVVTLSDFTEVTINNLEELQQFARECNGENEQDDDIECVDFVYPITMSKYDADNQLIETVTVESDRQFYRFMHHLEDGHVVAINFPITMELYDGTQLTINNMEELREIMQEAEFMCDEDDDYDYDDDDCKHCTEEAIIELLLECNWSIHKLVVDEQDNTEQYRDFLLKFFEDGTVKAFVGNEYIYGTWELTNVEAGGMGDDSHNSAGTNVQRGKYLTISFENLTDFSFKWMVYEKDDHTLDLRIEHNRLKLVKVCEDTPNQLITALQNILNEGVWEVALFENNGVDETENYNDFGFEFNENLFVVASRGNETIEGQWSVDFDDDIDALKLELSFGATVPFDQLNEDWQVISKTDERIELKYIDTEAEEELRLVFERR